MSEKNTLHQEWQRYAHLLERREIAAKTCLLREGQISSTAFLVEQGCVRSWFNNNGKEVTFQFFMEGEIVSSVESLTTRQKSMFSLETIEPSVVLSLSMENIHYILKDSPRLKKEMEAHIFQRLFFYQRLFLSRIKDSPAERYQELLKEHPGIIRRIPQHYIASFLGITPVSLSRIRNRQKKRP